MSLNRMIGLLVLVAAVVVSLSRTSRHGEQLFDSPRHESHSRAHKGEAIEGKVVSIADGDTLTVLDDGHSQHRIRLFGIDAPEKNQAFGPRSKENLSRKVFGQMVHVDIVDVDRYGREVGKIYLGRRFINKEQVEEGLAWRYTAFDRSGEFTTAEAEARRQHLGLWADAHPVPPWDFRREERERGVDPYTHHNNGSGNDHHRRPPERDSYSRESSPRDSPRRDSNARDTSRRDSTIGDAPRRDSSADDSQFNDSYDSE